MNWKKVPCRKGNNSMDAGLRVAHVSCLSLLSFSMWCILSPEFLKILTLSNCHLSCVWPLEACVRKLVCPDCVSQPRLSDTPQLSARPLQAPL